MFGDLAVREYIERVASDEPVPGGGSVAALTASLAAGLAEMVARLTLGRGDAPGLDERMSGLIERAAILRARLLLAADEDSEAYGRVLAAYRMAKATDEEKQARRRAIREALKGAASVPLSVARMAMELLDLLSTAINEGNENAVTDGLVGALLARSALLGAVANVRINLRGIDEDAFRREMGAQADALESKAQAAEQLLRSAAQSKLAGGR
jgi:formiminotetrahydrofolate cyclodeaminase